MDEKEYTYESVAYVDQKSAERLVEFLQYSGIDESKAEYNRYTDTYEVKVYNKNFTKANNLFEIFKENESINDCTISHHATVDHSKSTVNLTLYDNIEEKYKDNLSSAYTFLICGFAGIILLILEDLNLLKLFSISGASNILFNVVIGLLFLGFIVIGLYSLNYSKKLKAQVQTYDDELVSSVKELREILTKEEIEASYDTSIAEEMKYFNRIARIKEVIDKNHSEFNEELVARICDEYYYELFN